MGGGLVVVVLVGMVDVVWLMVYDLCTMVDGVRSMVYGWWSSLGIICFWWCLVEYGCWDMDIWLVVGGERLVGMVGGW